MRHIAFFELVAWEKDWIVKHLGGFELSFNALPLDFEHVPDTRDVHALCIGEHSQVIDRVLRVYPKLELIAVRSRNIANVDLVAARERGVMVCRLTSFAAPAVAEFTFALLLALSRNVGEGMSRVAKGESCTDGLEGFNLFGKTLGVIGTGNIGSRVIRIARGFGMRVIAWNPKRNAQLAAELGFAYASLEDVVAHADVLTIHMPHILKSGNAETRPLIHKDLFDGMKRGVRIINTSHEDVLELDALLSALDAGTVGGAALDVFAGDRAHALQKRANVILTPHMAYHTRQTHEDVLRHSVENISAYFRGFPQGVC